MPWSPRPKPRGRPPKLAEREQFLKLIAQGMGDAEASRSVGINRRTGYIWRHGRTVTNPDGSTVHYPPLLPPPPPISPRFLSEDERILIADRLHAGATIRAIAAELGRSPSTISREIHRNRNESGAYRPFDAHRKAALRRARPKTGKLATNTPLRTLVQDMLARRLSPEQISHRLRREHPDTPELHVSHETIYQALYVQARGELRREIAKALRTGRTIRKPRRTDGQRQPRFIHPMLMISDRPAEIEDRAVPGHWEGDLIIGKGGTSAIATLVERTTRYLLLVHLGADHTAERVRDGLLATINTLPTHLKRSLTWDQGSEMSLHHQFTLATDMPVYFCDPHSPWQRGTNENTNALLRQYFPKSTDLALHSPDHLAAVAAELNTRPRKTLDWDTPAERLTTLLTNTT